MPEISVNVRCSGKMHKISIMPGGAFVLHDHIKAEVTAERILAVLGGEPCRCAQVLDAWRQQNDWQKEKENILPIRFRPSFKKAIALSRNRKRQRQYVDKLTTPIDVRIKTSYMELIRATWLNVPGTHRVGLVPRDGLNVAVIYFLMKGHNGYARSALVINIAKWYRRVYKRGLAIIDDVFILDVLSSDENGHIVQAVQVLTEGEAIVGITASMARVTIVPNEVGALKLNWLTDEQ